MTDLAAALRANFRDIDVKAFLLYTGRQQHVPNRMVYTGATGEMSSELSPASHACGGPRRSGSKHSSRLTRSFPSARQDKEER